MVSTDTLLREATALILDFDGPMAALMPPPSNAVAAQRTRDAAGVYLPKEIRESSDHIAVLRYLVDQPAALVRADSAAEQVEIQCTTRCAMAPWLGRALTVLAGERIPWGVATNNSARAVTAFIQSHHLPYPAVIAGRTADTVGELKPHPFLLEEVLRRLGVPASGAIFVGDSTSDMAAALSARIAPVGYAKDAARARRLRESGAMTIVLADADRTDD